MSGSRNAVCLVVAAMLFGCGGNDACEKPGPYQESIEGPRIEVPEGLTELQPSRELRVPETSPPPPRPADAPCLELPPSYTKPDS